ncbi:hypothetical protein BC739_003097 [Kutzneria viridogrisea]|uniref:Uncharacterized protein n=1 Tax=Kutzneria viridogrisea TaxID=47990 RepID=A0ABR6BG93_9PSEU|nr:hypothetical protein [Kutzneria viridogrisea]
MNGDVSEVVTGSRKTGHHHRDRCDRSSQDHAVIVQLGHGVILGEPVTEWIMVTGVTGTQDYQPLRARAHAQSGRTRQPVTPVTPVTMINLGEVAT